MKYGASAAAMALIALVSSAAVAAEPAQRERIHAAVQEICPISGEKLGAHGPPIKVKVGEEAVFICCRGCLQNQVDPQHWATIHANFARAQRICPVMKQELPAKPAWTIVQGQIFYVCCPPCTKKIAAEPQAYLQQLDGLYAESLRQTQRGNGG